MPSSTYIPNVTYIRNSVTSLMPAQTEIITHNYNYEPIRFNVNYDATTFATARDSLNSFPDAAKILTDAVIDDLKYKEALFNAMNIPPNYLKKKKKEFDI